MNNNDYRPVRQKLREFGGAYSLKVSVVLPVYNGTPLLARTLAALKAQSYPATLMEVVVADDGSSDGLKEFLADFRAPFAWGTVHQARAGFRLASVRNKAIRAATGDVVVALDADMAPLPRCIEAHAKWFHLGERVATIGSRRFVDMGGLSPSRIEENPAVLNKLPTVGSASDVYPRERRLRELRDLFAHPAPWTLFHGCNAGYFRADALACGLYDEEFDGNYGYEDIEFGYRLYSAGVYLIDEPDACALHQENEGLARDERVRQSAVNYELARRKIPGLAEFRARLATGNYVPWWQER